MSEQNKKQAEYELNIFKKFADAAPLNIIKESIESCSPKDHEPDIYCKLENGDALYFELTEFVSQKDIGILRSKGSFQHRINKWLDRDECSNEHNEATRHFKKKFDKRVIHITANRQPKVSNDRQFKHFIEQCCLLDPNITTKQTVDITNINHVNVYQSNRAAEFNMSLFGWSSDAPNSALNKIERWANKKNKPSFEHPIHLFTYIEKALFKQSEEEITDLVRKTATKIPESDFAHLWLFDCNSNKVLFSSDTND